MRNTAATILPALAILLLSACGTVGTDTIVELPIDQTIEGFSAIEISGPIETNVVYGADHGSDVTLAGTASPFSGSFWHGATADLARMTVQRADIVAHHGSTVHVSANRSLVALSTHGSVVELGAIPESLSVREESGGKVNGTRSVSVGTDE